MIARVWYSKAGAELGHPWWVKMGDNPPERCTSFQLVGVARPVFVPEGDTSLPDGPRAYLEIEIGAL